MKERRGAQRYKKEMPVFFSNSGEKGSGISSDFSASGIFIITRDPYRPGTSIEMILHISETERIRLAGIVVRTIKTGLENVRDGMGIKLNQAPFSYDVFIRKLASG